MPELKTPTLPCPYCGIILTKTAIKRHTRIYHEKKPMLIIQKAI